MTVKTINMILSSMMMANKMILTYLFPSELLAMLLLRLKMVKVSVTKLLIVL